VRSCLCIRAGTIDSNKAHLLAALLNARMNHIRIRISFVRIGVFVGKSAAANKNRENANNPHNRNGTPLPQKSLTQSLP
jgi:hypothetical protein